MGVKYSSVHRSATVAQSGRVRSHGYSTREAVKLCHIGVADSKDKQKGAIASFVLGSDVLFILATGYGQSLCFTLLPLLLLFCY